ncbi:hypothetical protein [Lederbergia galactosidilytica]|nr:hypothetical protein [Lederbergia galactosidilytica]
MIDAGNEIAIEEYEGMEHGFLNMGDMRIGISSKRMREWRNV